MIYFISDGNNIKIGYTFSGAKARLGGLQTSNPKQLKILKIINGDKNKETELHNKFKHIKVRGEWFKATDELNNFINSLENYIERPSPKREPAPKFVPKPVSHLNDIIQSDNDKKTNNIKTLTMGKATRHTLPNSIKMV